MTLPHCVSFLESKEASRCTVQGTGLSSLDKHLYSGIVPASMQVQLSQLVDNGIKI